MFSDRAKEGLRTAVVNMQEQLDEVMDSGQLVGIMCVVVTYDPAEPEFLGGTVRGSLPGTEDDLEDSPVKAFMVREVMMGQLHRAAMMTMGLDADADAEMPDPATLMEMLSGDFMADEGGPCCDGECSKCHDIGC